MQQNNDFWAAQIPFTNSNFSNNTGSANDFFFSSNATVNNAENDTQQTIKSIFKNCTGGCSGCASAVPKNETPGCGCSASVKKNNWMQKMTYKNVLIASLIVVTVVVLFTVNTTPKTA